MKKNKSNAQMWTVAVQKISHPESQERIKKIYALLVPEFRIQIEFLKEEVKNEHSNLCQGLCSKASSGKNN